MSEIRTSEIRKRVEFTWFSIVKILITICVIAAIYYMREFILLLFICILLTTCISPIVTKISKKIKVPRFISIAIVYALILGLVLGTVIAIIPPLYEQLKNIYHLLPSYIQKIAPFIKGLEIEDLKTFHPENIEEGFGIIIEYTASFFGGVFNFLFVLIVTLFLLVEENFISKYSLIIIPKKYKDLIIETEKQISARLSAWFVGQLFIMLLVGMVNFLFFLIVGVPYAVALGVFAFLLESIPNIGPIIAAIPALILAYMDVPWKALAVLVFVLILHQVGSQFLVPKIMEKAIGVSAFVIVLALIIGGELAGIAGMVLALPVIILISIFADEYGKIRINQKNRIKSID